MSEKPRTKRWAPKSFSGCLTCKRRRVKCDESKPTCQRCAKSGVPCDGYASPSTRSFNISKPRESSSSSQTDNSRRSSNDKETAQPKKSPLTPQISPEEQRLLQFYREKTSDLISLNSQRHFWCIILPQVANQQSAIRHSLVALAVLHETLSRIDMSQSEGIQRFLHHYNASIRALIHDQPPTFVVLMACLLFWAIENFNGGDVVAHAHLTAAVRILNEWKATNPTPDTEDPSTEMITKYIEPCIQDGLRQLPSATVPLAPDEPEEGKGKQPETLSDLRLPQIQFQTTLGNFSSLEEATKNLHTNLQHLLDLQVLGYAYSGDHGRIRDVIHAISSQLDKWLGSFSGIMHSADVAPKRVLFIHHIVAKFLLREVAQTVKAEDDLEEPDITPHLNYVVTEIDEMMQEFNHIKTQSSPSKDLSTDFPPNLEIIPALFAAATSSTEIATRVKAIDLLKKLDRTEGAWNSKVAACVAETILGLGNARRFSISSDTEPSSHTISFNTLKFYWRLDSRHRLNITIVHSPTEGGSVTIDKQLQCTNEEISALNLDLLPTIVCNYGFQFHLLARRMSTTSTIAPSVVA